MSAAKATIDHDEIRAWVESRGGCPARVKRTGKRGDPGILRIDYTGFSGVDTLQKMSWDDWFEAFDENNLAFLYQETRNGRGASRFSKLVDRSSVNVGAKKTSSRGRAATPRRASAAKRTAAARKTSTTKRRTKASGRAGARAGAASTSTSRPTSKPRVRGAAASKAAQSRGGKASAAKRSGAAKRPASPAGTRAASSRTRQPGRSVKSGATKSGGRRASSRSTRRTGTTKHASA
jgi:hypothetical protein